MQSKPKYNIKAVSRITGLSDHVIRAWERRYQAVEPERTDTNRREYSGSDIEKLLILKKATEAGLNIGTIASLPLDKLKIMMEPYSAESKEILDANEPSADLGLTIYTLEAMNAIKDYSPVRLDDILRRAHSNLGLFSFLESVLIPLLNNIGGSWAAGSIRIAQEHLASSVIIDFLHSARAMYKAPADAPLLISATPAGELHEIGALIVSAVAALSSWKVLHLGANLPYEEIIASAENSDAAVVCLSVVNRPPEKKTGEYIKKVSESLNGKAHLLVGGRAASFYKEMMRDPSVIFFDDISQLSEHLAFGARSSQ